MCAILYPFIHRFHEGTAIDALPHMHTLLDSRPEGFHSEEDAIEWQ